MAGAGRGEWSGPAVSESAAAAATHRVKRVRHLVVDSGAIIKEIPLHELADHLVTVPDVIQEIKDKRARHVLESLPKRLELREPSAEALKFIVQFSRRTGDFRSISDADIRVLALCYDLEKKYNGTTHLNKLPYHELHTSDAGKPLFVTNRRYRRPPAPEASAASAMGDVRLLLTDLYSLKSETAVGMGNKFHRTAVAAMVKRHGEPEVVSILEQYRKEVANTGKEKTVNVRTIGRWFSGQLKRLSKQLTLESEEKKVRGGLKDKASEATTGKRAAPLSGAAAMRALAKARRAATGNAWGAPSKPTQPVANAGDFPKLVVTKETHGNLESERDRHVGVGTRVAVLPIDAKDLGSDVDINAAAFAFGTVANAGANAMATVHLEWQLADGSPATLYAPITRCVPCDVASDAEPSVTKQVAFAGLKTAPASTADTSAVAEDGAEKALMMESERATTAEPVPEVRSRILPSASSGLATVVDASDIDGEDGGEWVTPANIGDHIGQGGFARSLDTVSEVPKVGCITMDFAMQNVMLQVGLNLVSAGGAQIRRVQQWVLYCGACFHEMRDMERLFCAQCGSPGVSKLAVSLTRQGKLRRHFSRNRKVKLLGERYSLPKPKGGRQLDLLLREDQLLSGGWRQQANKKGMSHSFMGQHVLGSIGMRLGAGANVVVGMGRKNPNAQRGRERRGKKKKTRAKFGPQYGRR